MADAANHSRFLGLIKQKEIEKDNKDLPVFGEKVGFFTKFFGCVHKNLSRPFISNNISYRTCLQCGARKRFDTETFKTFGDFYFPPAERPEIGKIDF